MKIGLVILGCVFFLLAIGGVVRAVVEIMSRYQDRRWISRGFIFAAVAGALGTAIMLFSRYSK